MNRHDAALVLHPLHAALLAHHGHKHTWHYYASKSAADFSSISHGHSALTALAFIALVVVGLYAIKITFLTRSS